MNQFIAKSALTFLLAALIIQLHSWWMLKTYRVRHEVGPEVYRAIASARQFNDAPIVLLGDSVTHQLASTLLDNNAQVIDLSCNAAISLAGHYLLLKRFSEFNDLKSRKVIISYHPDSFRFNLNDKFTFGYFARPFYDPWFRDHYPPIVCEKLDNISFAWLLKVPSIRASDWSPSMTTHIPDSGVGHYPSLSDVSIDTLRRFRNLSRVAGFSLIIISSPVCDETYSRFDLPSFKKQIEREGLSDLFGAYFLSMDVLPRNLFRDDDTIHFRGSAIGDVKWNVMKILEP